MADINVTYQGTIDQADPDVVIAQLPGFFPWSAPRNIYLPDEVRELVRKTNAEAITTQSDVKVPYTGNSTADRVQWLTDRVNAINKRVAFISVRVNGLLDRLKSSGSSVYDGVLKGFTTALSAIPVVGSVVSFFSSKDSVAQAVDTLKIQTLIQGYTSELNQLAIIKKSLIDELIKLPSTDEENKLNAPTVWPSWYYYLGVGVALIFLFWYLRKRKKRKR
jgi:hypothetical protein